MWLVGRYDSFTNLVDYALVSLIRRSTKTNVGKPEIGLHLAKSLRNASEIPEQIRKCIQHAYEVANR